MLCVSSDDPLCQLGVTFAVSATEQLPGGDNSHLRWLLLLVRSNSKVIWGVCLSNISSTCMALCWDLGQWDLPGDTKLGQF